MLCADFHQLAASATAALPPAFKRAWKVLLPRDASCMHAARSFGQRARRQGSTLTTWSAFGKLRRRPTAPHRGPAGLGNAGQAASSASARSRGPRTVKSLCGASPLYWCFTVQEVLSEGYGVREWRVRT